MRFLKMVMIALLVFSSATFVKLDEAQAASNISIYLNDAKQSYSNKAMIKNGVTLVPLRGIFEGLGANVNWNASNKTIDASKGSTKIWLKIGSKTTKVNGKSVTISVPAQIVNGSTLVPLRFISESLGAQVNWVPTTKTVKIYMSKGIYTAPVGKSMKVHFLDVDQGDSTFVQLADGKTVLIDAGPINQGGKVVAYLKSLGVKKLDYLISTHPDADHIGGMVDVLNAFEVATFVGSGKVHTSKTYENTLLAIQAEGSKFIIPTPGQILEQDRSINSYLSVIYSDPDAAENNDASLVIAAGYCSQDVLLMGDADVAIESNLVATNKVSEVEILKAGHHGSNTSSSLGFLKTASPEAVILSYGENNDYGHPHQSVLTNIKKVGAKAYSTAQAGTIVATLNCNGYTIDSKEFKAPGETVQPTPVPVPTPSPKPSTGDVNSGTYVVAGAATSFKNCTAMRTVYPSGVKSSHPAYESKHDRDNDGWACEK